MWQLHLNPMIQKCYNLGMMLVNHFWRNHGWFINYLVGQIIDYVF